MPVGASPGDEIKVPGEEELLWRVPEGATAGVVVIVVVVVVVVRLL